MRKTNMEMRVGGIVLSLYAVWAIGWWFYSNFKLGELGAPYWPAPDMRRELLSPWKIGAVLGTDVYGRSLAEIISAGLSYSLGLSLMVSLASASIGVVIGYASVTGPSVVRRTMDMATNIIFVLPSILIAIMVMSVIGQSRIGLVATLTFTGWPSYARIARGETLRVLSLPYVESAQAVGMTSFRLFYSVILPAILPFVLAHFILGVSGVVVSESTLGFLGLGGSEYSWGSMLAMGKSVLLEAPHVCVTLSLVMAGLIIGLNLMGDGLRDYLDPKTR